MNTVVLVTGLVNVLEPSAITGIVWVCAPCIPAYAVCFSYNIFCISFILQYNKCTKLRSDNDRLRPNDVSNTRCKQVTHERANARSAQGNCQGADRHRSTTRNNIFQGLVLQACLPAVYTFSCGTYLFGQLNILRSVPIEYITHMVYS